MKYKVKVFHRRTGQKVDAKEFHFGGNKIQKQKRPKCFYSGSEGIYVEVEIVMFNMQ